MWHNNSSRYSNSDESLKLTNKIYTWCNGLKNTKHKKNQHSPPKSVLSLEGRCLIFLFYPVFVIPDFDGFNTVVLYHSHKYKLYTHCDFISDVWVIGRLTSGLNLGVIDKGSSCFNYHQHNKRYIHTHHQPEDNFYYLLWWQPQLNLWEIPFHVLYPGGNSKASTGKIVCVLSRYCVNHRNCSPPILLSNNPWGVNGLTRDEVRMAWRISVKLPFPNEDLVIGRYFTDQVFGSRIAARGNTELLYINRTLTGCVY